MFHLIYVIIVLPAEVTVNSIKSELSSFDGPSSHRPARHRVGMVKEESEEPPWEPALWQQQYENIRTMRSKRDAPVDKFGCFMNAEKEVLPEVLYTVHLILYIALCMYVLAAGTALSSADFANVV